MEEQAGGSLAMSPLVSVVMPFHNRKQFLRAAVDSILNQTVRDLELIVVDDCSTDGATQIIEEYEDPRIVRIQNETNLGVTRSNNVGLRRARGEYVARMDSDDIALPHRFETQIKFLEKSAAAMTHSNVEYIDENDRVLGESNLDFDPALTNWNLLFDSYAFQPTFMWKRAIAERELGEYDERFIVAQDFDFSWRAMKTIGFEGIAENLLKYRVHGNNITTQRRALQLSLVGGGSIEHIAEQLQIPVAESEALFEGVRELTLFRDPKEWTPERVEKVLPRYIHLWQRFLDQRGALAWATRTQGLKAAVLKDLINATGILIAARDLGRLTRSIRLISSSHVVPGPLMVRAIVSHRWNEKLGRKAAYQPSW